MKRCQQRKCYHFIVHEEGEETYLGGHLSAFWGPRSFTDWICWFIYMISLRNSLLGFLDSRLWASSESDIFNSLGPFCLWGQLDLTSRTVSGYHMSKIGQIPAATHTQPSSGEAGCMPLPPAPPSVWNRVSYEWSRGQKYLLGKGGWHFGDRTSRLCWRQQQISYSSFWASAANSCLLLTGVN